MNNRKTAVIVGILFIVGTVAGVLSGIVSGSMVNSPDYLNNIAADPTRFITGTLLVLVMGFPLAMVPVMLYPIFKKYNQVLALGAVVFRGVLEAVCYMAMVIVWLLLMTLSREFINTGAPDASYFRTLGTLLQTSGRWVEHILAIVFSLGAMMIYALFYRSRLIPRWLAGWGFIGAVLYIAAPLINMFDPQLPMLSLGAGVGIFMAPLAVQEMVFAV